MKACEQRSGASAPTVHFTTSERNAVMRPSCCSVAEVEATYLALLIAAFLAIAVGAVYVVVKLFAGQR